MKTLIFLLCAPSVAAQLAAQQLDLQLDLQALERVITSGPHFDGAPGFVEGRPNRLPDELPFKTLQLHRFRGCKNFAGSQQCGSEWDDWTLAKALVPPDSTVLEFGAKHGATSCVLARATRNSGKVISVEPDDTLWKDLMANRDKNKCNFHIVKGTVSSKSMKLTSIVSDLEEEKGVPHVAYKDVEKYVGSKIDTLLIHCGGCITDVFEGNEGLLDQVNLILLKQSGHADYDHWFEQFKQKGFERVWYLRDTFGDEHNLYHSAWKRGGLGHKSTCEEYKAKFKLPKPDLDCVPQPNAGHSTLNRPPAPAPTHSADALKRHQTDADIFAKDSSQELLSSVGISAPPPQNPQQLDLALETMRTAGEAAIKLVKSQNKQPADQHLAELVGNAVGQEAAVQNVSAEKAAHLAAQLVKHASGQQKQVEKAAALAALMTSLEEHMPEEVAIANAAQAAKDAAEKPV